MNPLAVIGRIFLSFLATIGDLTLPNRIAMAPLTRNRAN